MGKKTYRLFKKAGIKGHWQMVKVENYENINQAVENLMPLRSEMKNLDGRVYENSIGEQYYISEE